VESADVCRVANLHGGGQSRNKFPPTLSGIAYRIIGFAVQGLGHNHESGGSNFFRRKDPKRIQTTAREDNATKIQDLKLVSFKAN